MTRIRKFVCASSALLLAVLPGNVFAQPEDLAAWAPESHILFAEIADIPSTRKDLREHELIKRATPPVSRYLKAIEFEAEGLEDIEQLLEEDFDLTVEEILDRLSGRLVATMGENSRPEESDRAVEYLLMVETSASEEWLYDFDAQVNEVQTRDLEGVSADLVGEEIAGVTVYTTKIEDDGESYDGFSWALVDGILITGEPNYVVFEAVERAQNGGDSLADNDQYKTARDTMSGQAAFATLNLAALLPILEAQSTEALAKFGGASEGIDAERFFEMAGFAELNFLSLGIELDREELIINSILDVEAFTGLIAPMVATGGELPEGRWLPGSSISSGISNFDFGGLIAAAESIFEQVAPPLYSQYQTQLEGLKARGLDLRAALFENFEPGVASATVVPPGLDLTDPDAAAEVASVIAIQMREPKLLRTLLETAVSTFAPGMQLLETSEYLNYEILGIRNPGAQASPTVSLAFTANQFLYAVGPRQAMREALSGVAESGEPFLERARVREALATMPGQLNQAALTEAGPFLTHLLGGLQPAIQAHPSVAGQDMPDRVADLTDLDYSIANATWIEGNQVRSRAILAPYSE